MPNITPSSLPTEAAVVADLAQRAAAEMPDIREHDDGRIAIWPKNQRIESLERFDSVPRRKRGSVECHDPDSFARYVRAHATDSTLVLGASTTTPPAFVAVLDYHAPETRYEEAETAARLAETHLTRIRDAGWAEHRAIYPLVLTAEWSTWTKASGCPLPQAEFAEFLEDNAPDIYVPPEAAFAKYPNAEQMLDVALTLQAKKEVQFSSGIRLQNGQNRLNWVEAVNATAGSDGKLEIPERFAISVAPFVGASKYVIHVRLRYRIAQGKITFVYQLERPHKALEHAFSELTKVISEKIGRPVLAGRLTSVNEIK